MFTYGVPVGDNAVLDRILQGQDTPQALNFITHVGVFMAYAHHGYGGKKHGSWHVVTSEASFVHARVIADECGAFFFHYNQ